MSVPDRSHVVEYLRSNANRPLKAKELANAMGVGQDDYHDFKALLHAMEEEGAVYRVKKQRYAVPQKINLVVGRLQTIKSGAGFVIPDEAERDVFVPPRSLGSAVDGDRVVVRVEHQRKGEKPQGTIIKVLERSRQRVVGVYRTAKSFGFVEPDDRKLSRDIFIPPDGAAEATDGQVVVVEVEGWGDERLNPSGRVIEVLGSRDDPGVDVLSIVHGHDLPLGFPAGVEQAARELHERGVTTEAMGTREDLRDRLVFTIDPADARDHDDALSIQRVEDGVWEVAVHIADVCHYVEEGGAIDAEAFRRGTSVYLVDRVIPMLPEELSTDLCSLRPDEDRHAITLLVRLTEDGTVRSSRLLRSVIRSRHKLSYEQAQQVLDGKESISADVDDALLALLHVSRGVRAARAARGSIDFDLPEARVVLNQEGEPTDIQRVLRLEAHRLIEDFMILANETVARTAANRKVPFIYRIHEAPDADRVETLAGFVATFGLRLRPSKDPGEFRTLLQKAEGRPEASLISTVMLRSMKQARYSTENMGHFGLASTHYSHFTSPIRRYADLAVHRVLTRVFVDGERLPEEYEARLTEAARIASERERVAVAAERDSIDLKKAEFMERHVGDEFSGTISGVTSFGLFVLLDDYFVDGLVHVSSLEDDYYVFLDEQYALIGEHSKRRFQLGERVRVKVENVNRSERQIDLLLAEEKMAGKSRRGGKRRGKRV